MVSKSKDIPWYYFLFGSVGIVIAFILFHKMSYKTTAKVATSNQDNDLNLGQKNNNPLNIRPSADKWLGETRTSNGLTGKFVQFKSIEYGYRAAIKLLWTYWDKHDCKTIRQIVTRWAPPTENKTEAYIAAVCFDTGILANTLLDFTKRDDYDKLLSAMSFHETNMRPTTEQLNKAWQLASN